MTSSATVSSTPTVSRDERWFGLLGEANLEYTAELPLGLHVRVIDIPRSQKELFNPFTQSIGIDLDQTHRLAVMESAFAGWNLIGREETAITNGLFTKMLAGFRPATIRTTRLGRRYASAAHELADLLQPEITIPTIAGMCGVSDRGFRNWLDGGGIRQKQSRRLMVIRALVKALVLQKGRDKALQWLQLPHPALGLRVPIDVISAGEAEQVFELALTARSRSGRRSSVLPEVEAAESEPTAQLVLAERGQLPAAEIYDLL